MQTSGQNPVYCNSNLKNGLLFENRDILACNWDWILNWVDSWLIGSWLSLFKLKRNCPPWHTGVCVMLPGGTQGVRHLVTTCLQHAEACLCLPWVSSSTPLALGNTSPAFQAYAGPALSCQVSDWLAPSPLSVSVEFLASGPPDTHSIHRLAVSKESVHLSLPSQPHITALLNTQHLGMFTVKTSNRIEIHVIANRNIGTNGYILNKTITHIPEPKLT